MKANFVVYGKIESTKFHLRISWGNEGERYNSRAQL